MIGTSIAHYRITGKLGEGGMGAVYRATDTRLSREVAIKVLPDEFARNGDRMARFQREAQVLASLNHPNIAQIYGVEERALIMELAEGSTLAERIGRGPMPVEEALPLAAQIADALEYAHERGVIHRDLKPANIKVTPGGRIKVLDFGLAKAMSSGAVTEDPKVSPTLTMRETMAGVIVGTAAYMAPEQARGQEVDSRADIWAFGVLLCEMLTGQPLFGGPTVSDTLASVLKTDPDLAAVPPEVKPVIERCLRKDPRRRWRSIGDVRLVLEEGMPSPPPLSIQQRQPRALPWVLAAALAMAAVCGWLVAWRVTRPVNHPLTRLRVDLGPEALPGLNLSVIISPDGRRLVFPARAASGRPQLATRLLDQANATLLPGTENATDPFFSPDGQWIGFYAEGRLKKIPVQGGTPGTVQIAAGHVFYGGSWGDDGNIISQLAELAPLSRIAASGGTAQQITKLGREEITHRWPQVLPGSNAVLFTASPAENSQKNATIQVLSLKTGQTQRLIQSGYFGRYLPSGHLMYVNQGVLFGVRFDLDELRVRGTPMPLLEDVADNGTSGGGQFDFSMTGTFVYAAGKSATQGWSIAWVDASGKLQPFLKNPGIYGVPRLSPDGRKLAFVEAADIYILDLERDTRTRLTFSGHAGPPVWAPDGKHIAFPSSGNSFSWMRSDGGGEPWLLLESAGDVVTPWSFSPDGQRLAFFQSSPDTGFDISTLALDLTDPERPKSGEPEPYLRTAADEFVPRFSPDGRWIAYRSNESGTNEIYVRPFPPSNGGKWQISSGGGIYALWSNNGRELFYETSDNRLMVLDYSINGTSFVPGKPRLWSERPLFFSGTSNLDLAPDGKRFAVFQLPEAASHPKTSVHVIMLLNFFDEVKRRIP